MLLVFRSVVRKEGFFKSKVKINGIVWKCASERKEYYVDVQ
jgi:hypothetical protein